MLIDSHCHPYMLDLSNYNSNFDDFYAATQQAGVDMMLCVGCDKVTSEKSIQLAEKYESIYASVGAHPSEKMSENREDDLSVENIIALAKNQKVIAIGETGLDYFYNKEASHLDFMRERFREHIQVAKKVKKPLIIHTRDARADTIKIMQEEKADQIGGVMHCFTESLDMAQAAIDLNFYISFSGIITFKNAKELIEVVKQIPIEKILIETDSPYLAPMPFRGKQNEPKYVKYVAEKVAELKNMSFDEVCKITSQNFKDLFFHHAMA